MRFLVIVKATADSEAGVMPSEQLLTEIVAYNQKLVDDGVLLAGEGLHPSSKGARVRLSKGEPTVVDGPFAETKELVAGYWVMKADSLEEVIERVKRVPNPDGQESEIEIRQIFEADDFGEEFTPEVRAQEERQRSKISLQDIDTYLNFDGTCKEAFEFYADVLGGEIEDMMPHRGTPAEDMVADEWADKIMHASMKVAGRRLMASDAPPGRYERPQGFSVSLAISGADEAERIFAALAEGGSVTMPIEKTFWATRFGMLVDRFGTPWMINCE